MFKTMNIPFNMEMERAEKSNLEGHIDFFSQVDYNSIHLFTI